MTEAMNKEFSGKPLDATKYKPHTPLEEAQDLCFQAFDAIGRQRIALARKAIQACPDCADAYVILAESAYYHNATWAQENSNSKTINPSRNLYPGRR